MEIQQHQLIVLHQSVASNKNINIINQLFTHLVSKNTTEKHFSGPFSRVS